MLAVPSPITSTHIHWFVMGVPKTNNLGSRHWNWRNLVSRKQVEQWPGQDDSGKWEPRPRRWWRRRRRRGRRRGARLPSPWTDLLNSPPLKTLGAALKVKCIYKHEDLKRIMHLSTATLPKLNKWRRGGYSCGEGAEPQCADEAGTEYFLQFSLKHMTRLRDKIYFLYKRVTKNTIGVWI